MSATTTTTKATTTKAAPKGTKATKAAGVVVKAISADGLKAIRDAFGTSDQTELSRIAIIQRFIADGQSIRQTLATVSKANGGKPVRGFSTGTVGRYYVIARHLDRDDAPKTTDAQYKRAALAIVNLANIGSAADVAAAVDMAIKAGGTGAAYAQALATAATAAGKASHKELTAARPAGKRNVAGEAANGGKAPKADKAPKGSDDDDDKPISANAAALSGATIGALVAELTRRFSGKGATVNSDDVEALTSLVSQVEALVMGDKVSRKR